MGERGQVKKRVRDEQCTESKTLTRKTTEGGAQAKRIREKRGQLEREIEKDKERERERKTARVRRRERVSE